MAKFPRAQVEISHHFFILHSFARFLWKILLQGVPSYLYIATHILLDQSPSGTTDIQDPVWKSRSCSPEGSTVKCLPTDAENWVGKQLFKAKMARTVYSKYSICLRKRCTVRCELTTQRAILQSPPSIQTFSNSTEGSKQNKLLNTTIILRKLGFQKGKKYGNSVPGGGLRNIFSLKGLSSLYPHTRKLY